MKCLFFVFTVAALCFLTGIEGDSCLEKVASFKKFGDEKAACIKSLNLTTDKVPASLETLKEMHFNDSCLANCTLESMKFFSKGTIQKDKILEIFKAEASADVYEKLSKAVETCVSEAEAAAAEAKKKFAGSTPKPSDSKTKEGKSGKRHGCKGRWICKRAAKFAYCLAEKVKTC